MEQKKLPTWTLIAAFLGLLLLSCLWAGWQEDARSREVITDLVTKQVNACLQLSGREVTSIDWKTGVVLCK